MVAKAKVKKFEVEKVEGTLDFELGDETFHCRPKLSGIALINFVRTIQKVREEGEESEASGASTMDALLELLQSAMGPKEYQRFVEYSSSEDVYVSMETIMEIVQYLIGEYTDSPSEAS